MYLRTSVFIFFTINLLSLDAFSTQNYNIDEFKKLEGFLNKAKKLMTQVSRGRYRIKDDQFNSIFQQCSLFKTNYNPAVGFIENQSFDPLTGQSITSAGTGTIIENDYDSVKVLTAAHVVRPKGQITFTLCSMLSMPTSDQVINFANYNAHKVFIHQLTDVAYLECNLVTNNIGFDQSSEDQLRSYVMERNHTEISGQKRIKMFHYPYAVEDQRYNFGNIYSGTQQHTVTTLGGSSGAPIILDDKIIGVHTGAGTNKGGTVTYEGETLDFVIKNDYVRLSNIDQHLNDFTERL